MTRPLLALLLIGLALVPGLALAENPPRPINGTCQHEQGRIICRAETPPRSRDFIYDVTLAFSPGPRDSIIQVWRISESCYAPVMTRGAPFRARPTRDMSPGAVRVPARSHGWCVTLVITCELSGTPLACDRGFRPFGMTIRARA